VRSQKKKEGKETKEKQADISQCAVCKQFLAGNCKHGFFGKTPKDGNTKCQFTHSKICRKFMGNGLKGGGCKMGRKCNFTHPKTCHSSL
jgi:hypothetical protein